MLKRILDLLGWLGVTLVLAAFTLWRLRPEWQWRYWLAIGGLVCTLLYMMSQWREVRRSFSGREAKFGTIAVVSGVVVLAILAAINYLGVRHNKRWDWTAAKQFTLSEQTRKVLEGLQKPLGIKVFAEPNEFQRFRDRLDEFQYASKQVAVEYIDAVKNPARAVPYKVEQLGTVVFEYEGRTERVTSDTEQELTNGLIKIVQGRQNKLYFLQGHGEKDTEGSDRTSYGAISKSLESENYTVGKLVLAQQKEVPADASILVSAGPKTDLFPQELEMLKRYIARGGKILFLLDPPQKSGGSDLPSITALLKDWSIDVGNNVIVDLTSASVGISIAAKYQAHAITTGFRLITIFPLARSVGPVAGSTSGKFAQTLVETSPDSWAESDIDGINAGKEVSRDTEKGDKPGPISLAAAVSAPASDIPPAPAGAKPEDTKKPETRIVVFGDSDFASNGFLGVQGNRDLFMNAVSWLAQQENLISIRPRDPQDRRITLTPDQQNLILILTVYAIPGLILLAGVFTWWRRR